MNRGPKNFQQRVKQVYMKRGENAREGMEFGCSATPAPTPPVSLCEYWNTVVGAGLYNNQVVGAGVGVEEVKIKDVRQHLGKPPFVSLTGRAGFSKPFPEGVSPSGPFIFKNLISGGCL